jgi:transcriptional regulator with XRE-family HTH domain
METIEKIKALRALHNFTQKEIADYMGLSLSAYKKIELGINKSITLYNLERIATILNTTVSVLTDSTTTALEPHETERERHRQIKKMEIKIKDYELQIKAIKADYTHAKIAQPEKEINIPALLAYTDKVLKDSQDVLRYADQVLTPLQPLKKMYEKIQTDNATLARFNMNLPAALR